jgi:predicted glycoside hydrolase/deacetylase ChbG (UPF0249 family)
MRRVIVNGDDFGQTTGITFGIVMAHEWGVLTSASLMVRWPSAYVAAAYATTHPTLDVGLHFDLGEWVCQNGKWISLYEVVSVDDRQRVRKEAERQLDVFCELLGRYPTHLDSHQHVHRLEPVRSVLVDLADRLQIPLRHCSPHVHYCGAFYGQTGDGLPFHDAIGVDALRRVLAGLPAGVTEIVCHPASSNDVNSMYREERQLELQTLCDPRVRETLRSEGIELGSFGDVPCDEHEPGDVAQTTVGSGQMRLS